MTQENFAEPTTPTSTAGTPTADEQAQLRAELAAELNKLPADSALVTALPPPMLPAAQPLPAVPPTAKWTASAPASTPASTPAGLPAPSSQPVNASAPKGKLRPVKSSKDFEKVDGPLADPLLLSILGTRRAHDSLGDRDFRLWLHAEIRSMGFTPIVAEGGSIIVDTDLESHTLFSCHIDTCHSKVESDKLEKQALAYDPAFGHIFLQSPTTSACLGGDDGVGVYIMLKMLQAKVPGAYLFHTGEERGGIGSKAVLASRLPWLRGFERCVAFDRAVQYGQNPEVVISQGGKPCASTKFGEALAAALNEGAEFDDPWVVSHKGSFTDSKVYSDVIPECVNVGCFYVNQHTPKEAVDAHGVEKLLTACLNIKWEQLSPYRVPAPFVYPVQPQGNLHKPTKPLYPPQSNALDFDDPFEGFPPTTATKRKKEAKHTATAPSNSVLLQQGLRMSRKQVQDMIDSDPDKAILLMCMLIAKCNGLQQESDNLYRFMV